MASGLLSTAMCEKEKQRKKHYFPIFTSLIHLPIRFLTTPFIKAFPSVRTIEEHASVGSEVEKKAQLVYKNFPGAI